MTTVADILNSRPSLQERAAAALQARRDAENVRLQKQYDELCAEATDFLRHECGCSAAELSDLQFERNAYNPGTVVLSVRGFADDLVVRFRYERRRIGNVASSQFDDEPIMEDCLVVEISDPTRKKAWTWKRVGTLADIGEALA